VLVAEDDEVNAMIVAAYLARLGIEAGRARNGREAVDLALRGTDRPDLVLMDCRMPEMDGLEATREIRRQERALGLPRLPVVALTATATESERALCHAAGMDDFVAKPFTMDELARALQRWAAAA
jgi:CheY-like chemotaxis protein